MTGIPCCCSSTLSARSNLVTSWSVLGTHQVQTLKGSRLHRRNLVIKSEVNFVNSEEAKKLIAVEGYKVLDVRDRIQFERAHIKDCYHIPLFIENEDNDLGTIIKRTVHNNFAGLFFGLPFTKPNPEFVQSVRSQLSPESKLLLVCQEGLSWSTAMLVNTGVFVLFLVETNSVSLPIEMTFGLDNSDLLLVKEVLFGF